jgi:hypothetical protein
MKIKKNILTALLVFLKTYNYCFKEKTISKKNKNKVNKKKRKSKKYIY